MPCRNDWDPPTKAQAENRRAAKLLIALNSIHGKTSSTQLLVDSTNPVLDTDYVKVLCERMKALGELGRDKLLYSDARDPRASELATWWEEHQERDRKRAEAEKKASEEKSSPLGTSENQDIIDYLCCKVVKLTDEITMRGMDIDSLNRRLSGQASESGRLNATLVSQAGTINELRERIRRMENRSTVDTDRLREDVDLFKNALHGISLASQNSACSKEELGRIARKAIQDYNDRRPKA